VNSNGNYGYIDESIWLTAKSVNGTEGGGGGISVMHSIPSYQVSQISLSSGGNTSYRNVPDVALNADPETGYIVVINGKRGQSPYILFVWLCALTVKCFDY